MSPLLAPDLAEIERTLDDLLRHEPTARVLAMRAPIRRTWPDTVQRGGRRFHLVWCPSGLDARERLDAAEADGDGLILLTPLDAAALGGDVLARLPHGRLAQSDRWTALRTLFRARDVDPRLRLPANRWMADLLLERAPMRGFAPVPGGVLDLESAWRAVLRDVLGLPEERSDAAALLEWSRDPAGLDRLARLREAARTALIARLGTQGGPDAALILAAAAAGRGADALPLALACGVVFGEADPRPALREAAIRLEPAFGGARVASEAGRALAEAGGRLLGRLSDQAPAAARAADNRAAAILTEIRAADAAALSPALNLGLEARIAATTAAIDRAVATGHADDAAIAWDRAREAGEHDRARDHGARLTRLTMAARLVGWLAGRPAPAWRTLPEAAAAYAAEGGFVDRARKELRDGDARPETGAAYARLAEAVTVRREQESRAFAALLREWLLRGADGSDPLPIEAVLARVVAPIARETPVLLLVLDGLSFAVWRELAETVARLGWSELVPAGPRVTMAAASVLPSVTEVSRTSLLCGALTRGDQGTERAGFAGHALLLAASRAGRSPRLFHKADVGGGPELEPTVREVVADTDQRIVGIVHNAVDAQLCGSDQLDLTWSAEGLRQVAAILQVARDAGRTVIVAGDHGHVLEDETTLLSGDSGSRWRVAGPPARDGEILLAGPRVLAPAGAPSIIAAWSEKVRLSAGRAGGYHGGASPQEVLVPVAVLTAGHIPEGWTEAPPQEPDWWRGRSEDLPSRPAAAEAEPAPPIKRRSAESRQAELFTGPAEPAEPAAAVPPSGPPSAPPSGPVWIEVLFASDAYAVQRRLAGRAAPTDAVVRTLLEALAARGGRMSRDGLARALGVAKLRLGGLVSATRRVLNLDQAQVLRDDDDDIVLDEALLRAQFGIGDGR